MKRAYLGSGLIEAAAIFSMVTRKRDPLPPPPEPQPERDCRAKRRRDAKKEGKK